VADDLDGLSHANCAAKLLANLARQGDFGRFAGLDLAARELPGQGKGLIGAPLREQHTPTPLDQRRHHVQAPARGSHH
jgi:hypothetical protein